MSKTYHKHADKFIDDYSYTDSVGHDVQKHKREKRFMAAMKRKRVEEFDEYEDGPDS